MALHGETDAHSKVAQGPVGISTNPKLHKVRGRASRQHRRGVYPMQRLVSTTGKDLTIAIVLMIVAIGLLTIVGMYAYNDATDPVNHFENYSK